MKIHFPYYHQTITVSEGVTISDACAMAGHPLDLPCGGNGSCGKCLVYIRNKLGLTSQVLACQTSVEDNLSILLSDDGSVESQILTETISADPIRFDPVITGYPVAFGALNLHDDRAFLASLSAVLPVDVRCDDPQKLYNIMSKIRRLPLDIINVIVEKPITPIEISHNAAKEAAYLIDASAAKIPADFLGIAFDIGTTTVAGYLYDIENGHWLATAADENSQRIFGADVINRIEAAENDKADALKAAIIETMNKLIGTLCKKAHVMPTDIIHVIAVGNTTMLCLLTGIDPTPLGQAPFTSPIKGMMRLYKKDLAINISDAAVIDLLPPLGSFVGADTTALITAIPKSAKSTLVIDLGTNGEIALIDNRNSDVRITATSTACGPALEGGGITMGMRGKPGAIEHVNYENDHFTVKLIGNPPAKGICGSGIIDTVAALRSAELVKTDGTFISHDHALADMIVKHGKEKVFVLLTAEENSNTKEIIVTQKDIRAIQLAKSAIISAVDLLIQKSDISPDEIETVYLAGAFGNYIAINAAQDIGLLPTFNRAHFAALGNGAGMGAVRTLLSRKDFARALALPEKTTVINLADVPAFNAAFMKNTALIPKKIQKNKPES